MYTKNLKKDPIKNKQRMTVIDKRKLQQPQKICATILSGEGFLNGQSNAFLIKI